MRAPRSWAKARTFLFWGPFRGGMKRIGLLVDRGGLGAFDGEVDDDGLLSAAQHPRFDGLVAAGVELLVRNVGRDVDEIAGPGFVHKFEMLAPAEPCAAANDVKHGLQLAVMVRPGARVRVNHDGSGPELLRSGSGVGDRGGAGHSGSLQSVGVKLAGANDAYAVMLPIGIRGGFRLGHACPRSSRRNGTRFPLGITTVEGR